MEECYPLTEENPRKKANIFSKLLFLWMRKICYQGSNGDISLKDLYISQKNDQSKLLADKFQKKWDEEVENSKLKGKKPSLLKVIIRICISSYIIFGIFTFLNVVVIGGCKPFILAALIRCFTNGNYTAEDIALYGGGLCLITLISTFINHHTFSSVNLIGMRIRIGVSSLIYRKILKLSQYSLTQTTAGQVVNLLSNDVARFDLVVMALNHVWIGPIQVAIVSYLMWTEIGISTLAGIVPMLILSLPLQMFLGAITSKRRMEVAQRTDNRVRVMSEILNGIQVIKMYAWEKPFEYVVQLARKWEMKSLIKMSHIRAILVSFSGIVERTTMASALICYVLLGNALQADIVFSLSIFFNMLQMTLAIMFPFAISIGAETLVSIKRLQDFLMLEEKTTTKLAPSVDNSIVLKQVEASWVSGTPTLKDLNINLPAGSLCAVVGPVGSGKSSFLKLLLGELVTSSGNIQISGDVSYASQEPWLYASNVRNNILFGQEYDKIHYRDVVKACALEKDFEQLPEADKTMVGDRGVSLSGGQKARINLARAVYKDADIYLLDDPLSAVDTKVGRHLFDRCIVEYLKGKTRILVTHQLQYLKKADIIIVLNKGGLEAQGTFQDLSQSDLDFTKLLVAADETNDTPNIRAMSRMLSTISTTTTISATEDQMIEESFRENTEEIVKYQGSAFLDYAKNCTNLPVSIILFMFMLLSQVLMSGSDYWMTLWTEQEEMRTVSHVNDTEYKIAQNFRIDLGEIFLNASESLTSTFDELKEEYTDQVVIDGQTHTLLTTPAHMYIYAFLIISVIVVTLLRSFMYFSLCMRGSRNLHNIMFHCLLEAPMRFFDTNPAGRVLNRFSKDMGAIDELFPRALLDVIQILFLLVGIIVLIIIPNPYIAIILAILAIIFFKVREWYLKTAKTIKHIESIAKSPVFSYVSSTIDGLTTIRSTKNEDILMRQFDEHQDVHTSAWYLTVLCSAAFGLWLDLICVIFVCSVIGGFVLLDQYTAVGSSFAGLAISKSLNLVGMLQFGMSRIAQVVNYITSIERVLEYTQLEKEHPLETPKGVKIPEPWPSQGHIRFKNLYLKYIPTDPPVLNNLNIEIMPNEKIGIVGRTGAGKSTLIAALFRLAPTEGEIIIDSIDTQTLGLRDLRKRISIIPQEPVLFSATIRYNLDPFEEFKDEKLWDVLEEVELKDDVTSLEFLVTEGGSNFSVGQRQLICLARAILRNNKILVLDEATANVDPKTDALIQRTIRRKFKNCTVLTIAHRLNTIMDSDKVLVMDNGHKVEFDHPHMLVQNPDGYFTKMLVETGPTMTNNLRKIAQNAFETKFEPIYE